MINHVRNLLMNAAPGSGFSGQLGDEIIDPSYIVRRPPGHIQTLRQILFGAAPDREMLNYRCRQFMTLLHATELRSHVLNFDSRITYSFDTNPFLPASLYAVVITGGPLNMYHTGGTGESNSPDVSGKMLHRWMLVKPESNTVTATHIQGGLVAEQSIPLTVDTPGLFQPVRLPGTDLMVSIQESGDASTWIVQQRRRPQLGAGDLVATLEMLSPDVLIRLFGTGTAEVAVEPLRTLREVWYNHHETAYRLGAVLLAMALRTEASSP